MTAVLSLPCRRTTTSSSPSMLRLRTPSTSCAWAPRYLAAAGWRCGPLQMTLSRSPPEGPLPPTPETCLLGTVEPSPSLFYHKVTHSVTWPVVFRSYLLYH